MFAELFETLSRIVLIFSLHLTHKSFPRPLSAPEELRCFTLARAGDASARETLINHNLRLVAHIVKKYYAGRMEPDDLISIGTVGLIKAIDSFDYTKGARFATYASRCIENEILMVFRSLKRDNGTVFIDDPLGGDDDGNAVTAGDLLGDGGSFPEELEKKLDLARLTGAVKELSPRARKVIELRYGLGGHDPLTQQETAALLGISRSYVSPIETGAVQELRAALERPEKR